MAIGAGGTSTRVQPVIDRLAAAHVWRRWLQFALWTWCTATFLWLLPLGSWSAPQARPVVGLLIGFLLTTTGAGLVFLQRAVSRTESLRAALENVEQEPAQSILSEWLTADHLTTVLASVLAFVALTAAPLTRAFTLPGPAIAPAWFLQPLAGVFLALRWRVRGAGMAMLFSFVTFVAMRGWEDFQGEGSGALLLVAVLLTVSIPLVIGLLGGRLALAEGRHWVTEESLRAAQARGVLKASETRFRTLVQNASDVMTVLRADGTRWYVSPSVVRVMGYQPEQLVGANFFALVHPEDRGRVWDFYIECLEQPGINQMIEFRMQDSDGGWRYLESVFNNLLGDAGVAGVVVTSRDITERKLYEERLAHQAYHDALTGLPNRVRFRERLAHALTRAVRERHKVAVMFMDLDKFKLVNDTHGHALGDHLLIEVAKRLTEAVEENSTVSRQGGDEFTVLIENAHELAEVEAVAARIVSTMRTPFHLDGVQITTAASVGVVLSDGAKVTPDDLLQQADLALYRAKENGRGRYVVFDPSEQPEEGGGQPEAELKLALDRGELRVLFQPEIDLTTGILTGVEALMRWENPRRGLLSPEAFIPLAEEKGLMGEIGRWVLREACLHGQRWRRVRVSDEPVIVSVNLSARQFLQPDLPATIASVLRETGFDARLLRLEIRESVLMHNPDLSANILESLKKLGTRIAIDDFAAGGAPIRYLRRFPIDTIKIDRSFISGAEADDQSVAVVQALTSLAHVFNIEVVAEGIETPEQLTWITAARCDRGQGYYFARPTAPTGIDALLMTNSPHLDGGHRAA